VVDDPVHWGLKRKHKSDDEIIDVEDYSGGGGGGSEGGGGGGAAVENIAEPEAIVECVICAERPATTIVLPCHHSVLCTQCSNEVKGATAFNGKLCIICQQPIEAIYNRVSDTLE